MLRSVHHQLLMLFFALFIVSGCQLAWLEEPSEDKSWFQAKSDSSSGIDDNDTSDSNAQVDDDTPKGKAQDAVAAIASPEELIQIPLRVVDEKQTLTASEAFNLVSPAVVFVETPTATGSGAWIEPGYLVSNAHVVWPYDSVRIVFPNGEEHLDVPVIAWDLVADLAVLGPIETDVAPVAFSDGSNLQVGGDVFLIGYPGELEEFPQPTLTQGLLSRIRRWETIDLSFFQVDAAIAGGQSGGVMVTGGGDIIGISTYSFTEAGFGLVASAADFVGRLEALVNNVDPDSALVVARWLDDGSGLQAKHLHLADQRPRRFLFIGDENQEAQITLTGSGAQQLVVSDLFDYGLYEVGTNTTDELTEVRFKIDKGTPYLIEAWQESGHNTYNYLKSNVPFHALKDVEDNAQILIDKIYIGGIDYPGDFDEYRLWLDKGDLVEIVVDSMAIDPYLVINHETKASATIYEDDDSGGGPFGENAKLVFRAPLGDIYKLEVSDVYDESVGGYFLSVHKSTADESVAEPTSIRLFETTKLGKMVWYESEYTDSKILFPALWQYSYDCGHATACYIGAGGRFSVLEEELDEVEYAGVDLEEYVDFVLESTEKNAIGFELVKRETVNMEQDIQIEKLIYTERSGRLKTIRLIYLENSKNVLDATYQADTQTFEDAYTLFELSFDSFKVGSD